MVIFFLSLHFFLSWRYFPMWYQLTYMSGSPGVDLKCSPFCLASSSTRLTWTGRCPPNILCVPENISSIQMTLFDSGRPSGFKGSTALSVTQMSTLRVTCPLALLDTLVTLSSSLPHWCYPSSSSWGPCPDDRHSLPTVTCFPSFAYLCLHSQEASGAPIPSFLP